MALIPATLTYNGIKIGLTRTLQVSYEPIRDVDNSYLYTRVSLAVAGIISGDPSQSQGSPAGTAIDNTITRGVPASDIVRSIRHRLAQERCLLVYDVGDSGTPQIVSPPMDGDGGVAPVDALSGPVPGPLRITRVDGGKTFHVNFEVTTHLRECPGFPLGSPSALISNKYTQSHSIDGDFFTTLEYQGQAFFNTSVLENAQELADHYRAVILPPIERGFKRERIHIVATPMRNALSYAVTDVERAYDLGDTSAAGTNSNITDVDADYCVSSTGQAGAPVSLMTAHSVRVTVKGSKLASPWSLVKAAFQVAGTKLPISNPTTGYLTNINCVQGLTRRVVSLQATMLLFEKKAGPIPGLNCDGLQADNTFAAQGGLNPPPPSRGGTAGTYGNEAMTAAWQAACVTPGYPTDGPVTTDGSGPTYSDNPIVTTTVTPELPDISTGYSTAQTTLPYTEYRLSARIETSTGVVAAPLAGPVAIASTGDDGTDSPPGSHSPGGAFDSWPDDDPGSPTPADPEGGGGGGPPGGDAGDDAPTQVFLTLSRPTQRKVVDWSCERVGRPPQVPAADPTDPNLVLIDTGHIEMMEPNLVADGVNVAYRLRGRYVYGLKRPIKASESVPFPTAPWMDAKYGDFVMAPANFAQGIIDSEGEPAGGE